VGLFDVLRGQRAPKRANLDALFALTTARTTLEVSVGWLPSGRAAVCFKPVEMGAFEELTRDMDQLLELAGRTTGTEVTRTDDAYGYRWVALRDDDFDDLVTTAHLVNQTIEERGFSEQLLCSVFGFVPQEPSSGGALYFVYLYKRGTFYPFAPRGEPRRDSALELRLQGALAGELPIEPELERWYPVWGVPV
jgi:PspA associated protein B